MARRVALLSPCGWGNLGDAAILDTLICQLRSDDANVDIIGLTLNPADTRQRHKIDAMALRGFTSPHYAVVQAQDFGESITVAGKGDPGGADIEFDAHNLHGLREKLKRIPGAIAAVHWLRRVGHLAGCVIAEARHWVKSFLLMRHTDVLVVAGGGQLDEFWGGPWGHPYVLCRWAVLAKLTSTPFLVLSVGTGELNSSLGKFFVRKALELAAYRSYRDQGSKDLIAFIAVSRADPVVPDLALGYPAHGVQVRATPKVIGVSPMSFKGPSGWPDSDEKAFAVYLKQMVGLVVYLINAGYGVTLFPSVRSDWSAVNDLLAELPPEVADEVSSPVTETVEDLFRVYATIDLTVASRLHGVLLSHVAGRPAIALSYERKVEAIMRDFGNERFCFGIDGISIPIIVEGIDALITTRAGISTENARRLAAAAAAVDEQFAAVLGTQSAVERPKGAPC